MTVSATRTDDQPQHEVDPRNEAGTTMTVQEWQFGVLAVLARDLHCLLQRTVTVIFKSWGDPVVVLAVRGGEQVTIMARYENQQGFYTWGRAGRVKIGPDAARSIAEAAAA